MYFALASLAQLVGASFRTTKVCRFDIQSGHTPRLWVSVPSWGTNEKQLIDVPLSHPCFSLSLSLSPCPLSLSPINKFSFKNVTDQRPR